MQVFYFNLCIKIQLTPYTYYLVGTFMYRYKVSYRFMDLLSCRKAEDFFV